MRKTEKADWLFIIPATLVWAAALLLTARDFWQKRHARFRLDSVCVGGLVLMLVGVGMRRRAHYILGRQFMYGLRTLDDHQLVTGDMYQYVRHPAYTGDMLFHFGLTLFFGSLRGLLVMLLLIPCFVYRIHVEETMLIRRFGSVYCAYRQRSKRLLPFLF